MAAMSKQYEKNNIVATRHYFTFYITLFEPTSESYIGKFAVKNVHFEFAGSNNIVLSEPLQIHNNEVLSWEMQKIHDNLKKQNISLNVYQLVGVYTIAALIKYYKDAGFKYIFIPLVINYGRNSNLVHQAALIIDFTGKFLFYEPYGIYTKYEKSYADAVCEFFHIFDDCGLFADNIPQCITYHDFLNIDKNTAGGIQNILLQRNNARVDKFNIEYNQTLKELADVFPTYDFQPHYNAAEVDNQDLTFDILDLLFKVDSANIDKKFTDPDKIKTYDKILHKILQYYCCYNSKTCVTITLVEMNEFFKYASESLADDDISTSTSISTKIKNLYREFEIPIPNPVLMEKLNNLLDVFHNSDEIREIVTNSSHISETCSKLFKKTS
jgi:hypothetical protein